MGHFVKYFLIKQDPCMGNDGPATNDSQFRRQDDISVKQFAVRLAKALCTVTRQRCPLSNGSQETGVLARALRLA